MRLRAGSGAAFSADVELPVSAQALAAAYSLLIGVLIGLLYDVNRAWRFEYRSSMSAAVADTLFCVCAACVLFVFSMGALDGRLRLSMLFCAGAGWGVYWLTLSRRVLPAARLLVKNWVKLLHSMGSHLSIIRNCSELKKTSFQNSGLGLKCILTGVRPFAPEQLKGAQAVKHGRAGMITLLAAADPHRVRSGGSGQRRSGDRQIRRTRQERPRRKGFRELEEANCELEARLNRGRADKNERNRSARQGEAGTTLPGTRTG